MVKNYEISNRTDECEVRIKDNNTMHTFILKKNVGYTKKFYQQLLYDIENYNKGENYDDYINNKTVDLPIITCNNGELYFTSNSSFLGTKLETRVSNEISRGILIELTSYLL